MQKNTKCHEMSVGSATVFFTFIGEHLDRIEMHQPEGLTSDELDDVLTEIDHRIPGNCTVVDGSPGWRPGYFVRRWAVSYEG